jgi:hypothetical protein
MCKICQESEPIKEFDTVLKILIMFVDNFNGECPLAITPRKEANPEL